MPLPHFNVDHQFWRSGAHHDRHTPDANFEPVHNLKGRIDAYKEAAADPGEIIGQYQNDNVMMTNAVICLKDRDRAREIALSRGRGYLHSMVQLYHDTMPKTELMPTWPPPPRGIRSEEMLDRLIEEGWLLCGNPEEVAEQISRYVEVGCDQLVFGRPGEGLEHDEVLECLELFGWHVIPEHDGDLEHSTTRYRRNAVPKYSPINHPLGEIEIEAIPQSALLPLAWVSGSDARTSEEGGEPVERVQRGVARLGGNAQHDLGAFELGVVVELLGGR